MNSLLLEIKCLIISKLKLHPYFLLTVCKKIRFYLEPFKFKGKMTLTHYEGYTCKLYFGFKNHIRYNSNIAVMYNNELIGLSYNERPNFDPYKLIDLIVKSTKKTDMVTECYILLKI